MSHPTHCPECGAENSLSQEVTVESTGWRDVRFAPGGADGKSKVTYGFVEGCEFDDITESEVIECSKCKETWDNEEALLDHKPPWEHRCTRCDWWGAQDWHHGVERPECPGAVYRIDKKPEMAIA